MERRIIGVLSPKASGSITITENGNYDVVDVANAVVEVRPSGTIEITENGEHDVANYGKAMVDVKFDKKTIKDLLDVTQSCYNMFLNKNSLTSIEGLLEYNDTENVTTMYSMFSGCSKLTSIPQLNTSKVTTMYDIFNNCSSITTIPQLDTSSATNMSNMFSGCSKLTSIPQLNTSKVTDMTNMFNGCQKLTTIPLLNTSKVTKMRNMFTYCQSLEKIDLTYYNISSTSNSSSIFQSCNILKALIIRSFGTNYVVNTNTFNSSGIENGTGYIYVPRAMVDTLKSATNWSTFASQIRALEDYTKDGTTTGELDLAKMGLV